MMSIRIGLYLSRGIAASYLFLYTVYIAETFEAPYFLPKLKMDFTGLQPQNWTLLDWDHNPSLKEILIQEVGVNMETFFTNLCCPL